MELAILMGVPGSGKTSFFRSRFEPTHVHVSKDLMGRVRDRGARQVTLLNEAFREGRSVLVDNTNPTIASRADLIATARAHGARVVGYVLQTPPLEALARNRLREGRARVPDVAIFIAAKKFQPPSRAEGFDEIYGVRAAEGSFEVFPLH